MGEGEGDNHIIKSIGTLTKNKNDIGKGYISSKLKGTKTEEKVDSSLLNYFSGVSGWSIANNLIAALLFFVLIFFVKKCSRTFFLFFKNLFRKKTFLPRKSSFRCQQYMEELPVSVTGDKHLHAKSLLGDVDPPATYGLYIKKNKGGPARIEMNARAKGKKFKKIVKYIGKCIGVFQDSCRLNS